MIHGHWADKAGGLVALGGSYAPGRPRTGDRVSIHIGHRPNPVAPRVGPPGACPGILAPGLECGVKWRVLAHFQGLGR